MRVEGLEPRLLATRRETLGKRWSRGNTKSRTGLTGQWEQTEKRYVPTIFSFCGFGFVEAKPLRQCFCRKADVMLGSTIEPNVMPIGRGRNS